MMDMMVLGTWRRRLCIARIGEGADLNGNVFAQPGSERQGHAEEL